MHLIGNLTFEPRTFSKVLGEKVARRLPDLAEDSLIPVIEECFERMAPERVLRIDRLVCDLGTISFQTMQSEFPKLLAKALEAHFEDQPKEFPTQTIDLLEQGRSTQSNEESQLEVFLFILKHGHFPWWFAESEWENFPALKNWDDTNLETLGHEIIKSVSRGETVMIHRLVRLLKLISFKEFSTRIQINQLAHPESNDAIANAPKDEQLRLMIVFWLSSFFPTETALGEIVFPILKLPDFRSLSLSSRLLAEKFLNSSTSLFNQTGPLTEHAKEDLPTTDLTPLSYREELSKSNSHREGTAPPTEEEALTISNAGLILLHPFLARFFRSMKWLDREGNLKPKHQWHAVQALQYLSRGECGLAEPTLVLEKVLCGIPLGSLAEFPSLDESIHEECQQLLRAAIDHWSILKNTTPEGLRDGFLLRPGSLFQQDQQWHLRVERKAIDILLDHLPWPLRMVKLPWLKTPIHVLWQNS